MEHSLAPSPTTGSNLVPHTVFVIRHAQSEHHVRGLTGGWTDADLTELGRAQARALAARLAVELTGIPVTLYSSDLARALQTAEEIAAALALPVTPEPRLREHNNGAAANLTLAEAATRYPDTFNALWTMDLRPFPGAETWREFSDRLAGFLGTLPPDGPLPVLVTHGGAIMTIIAWWLRLDPSAQERSWFGTRPTGITVLRADRWGQRGLDRLGDIAHLHEPGVPPPFPLVSREA